MEMKPGYKRTEVGVIPVDWGVRNLSDLSLKITDGDHATPQRCGDGYYLLSARNILNGRIDVSDVDYVADPEYRRMRLRCAPSPGDVSYHAPERSAALLLFQKAFNAFSFAAPHWYS
jgi:type I restriction enzyme, S subunit